MTPTAITVMTGGATVFVAAFDTTTGTGYVFGFKVTSGSLTPMNGGVPFASGIHPAAITADPTGTNLYVADVGGNDILGLFRRRRAV